MVRHYFPDMHMRLDDGRYFVPINVAGVSYRQDAVARCVEEQSITLVRDKNAIMVSAGGEHIGFIPSGYSSYQNQLGFRLNSTECEARRRGSLLPWPRYRRAVD